MAGMYETDQPMKVAELGDTIFVAESSKTPFGRLLKRGKKPNQMLSEWPMSEYPDRAFDGTLDGTDISTFNHVTREKAEAYAMWLMTEGWLVSKLANLTMAAGVGRNEKAHQARMDALILAIMIERQLLSTMDTRAEGGGDSYRSRGALEWLKTSAQAVKPVPANFLVSSSAEYTGALASFAPSSFETMLEAMATQKRGPVDLTGIVGIKLKAQMSTWAQRDSAASATDKALMQYNLNASEKKLIHSVDFFQFDAGEVRNILSWYLACTAGTGAVTSYSPRSGIFVDLAMWELCFLQEPASYEEPPKSGGPRGYHDAVYILKCLNPKGQGKVYTAN